MGAVHLLHSGDTPVRDWIAGPTLNIFNPTTLDLFADLGATRWVAPPEMSREQIRSLRDGLGHHMEVEIFAHGRLPLAYSAAASPPATTTYRRTPANSAASNSPTAYP
jgi:collagenase-like PrtC family protease